MVYQLALLTDNDFACIPGLGNKAMQIIHHYPHAAVEPRTKTKR
jgi:hypothetical protein